MNDDILILTTGGTIDKVYFDARGGYRVGDPQIIEIFRKVEVTTTYRIENLLRKDSMDLTDDDRALIRRSVADAPHSRVLITHGTDTMIETARSLQHIPDKAIVLVGSLAPARFKVTDAEFNIGFAFAAALVLPPGVYLAMNGCIFDPGRVQKNFELNRFETL